MNINCYQAALLRYGMTSVKAEDLRSKLNSFNTASESKAIKGVEKSGTYTSLNGLFKEASDTLILI